MPVLALFFPKLLGWFSVLVRACLEVLVKPAAWLLIGAALLAGHVYGEHRQKVLCEAEKAASIAAARRIDQTAAADARAAMQQQIEARDTRLAETDRKIKEYEDALAEKPDPACRLSDDDLRRLGELQSQPVPGRPKGTASHGRRDPGRGGVR